MENKLSRILREKFYEKVIFVFNSICNYWYCCNKHFFSEKISPSATSDSFKDSNAAAATQAAENSINIF